MVASKRTPDEKLAVEKTSGSMEALESMVASKSSPDEELALGETSGSTDALKSMTASKSNPDEELALEETSGSSTDGDILSPPKTWVPPMGASARTWVNIMKNKNNIDYCVNQFHYLSNRIKCINDMTGGPFLD